jgi:hypothetical protein
VAALVKPELVVKTSEVKLPVKSPKKNRRQSPGAGSKYFDLFTADSCGRQTAKFLPGI